ncbi:MAG: aldo/keto reductase, partial [Anaerolineales bacterium]
FAGTRDNVVIATKVSNFFNAVTREVTGSSAEPADIRQACEDSLRRLNTDYIDLYQFHDNGYPADQAGPVLETLEELVKEGKIRAYGWSTDFPDRAVVFAQEEHCTAIQCQLNVLDDNPEVIAICEEYNLAAINRGPLAMGLLTGKYQGDVLPGSDDVRGEHSPEWMKYFKDGKPNAEWTQKITAVREILTSGGRTLAQGALAWLWARSETTIPIPGFRTVAQVKENCGAIEFGPLEANLFEEVEQILKRES